VKLWHKPAFDFARARVSLPEMYAVHREYRAAAEWSIGYTSP